MRKGRPIKVEYQTLVITWLALLMSQVMFLVIVWITKPEIFPVAPSADGFFSSFLGKMPLVTLVFAAIAIVFLALSFILRRQHMRRAVEDQDAGCVQTALVLGCALSEIPSLLGIILAFAFEHPYFYLWVALGTLGILFHFPRKGSLDAASYKLN